MSCVDCFKVEVKSRHFGACVVLIMSIVNHGLLVVVGTVVAVGNFTYWT